ncbi:MAG: TerB family tellurite resistance protein [Candidatus Eisenbacteria bacterium]
MNERTEVALVRLLVAAAWADGDLSPQETEYLEGVARDVGLDAAEWAGLRPMLDRPVPIEEAEKLAVDFVTGIPATDRERVLARIESLAGADGRRSGGESRLLSRMREAIEAADASAAPTVLSRVRGLLRRTVPRAPIREDEERFQRALLFAAIHFRVILGDGEVAPEETRYLRRQLQDRFGFGTDEAERILGLVRARTLDDLDRQRLCASFNRVSEIEERIALLESLFGGAASDGEIDESELLELRLIANYLWIEAREFHDVRMRSGIRVRENRTGGSLGS